MNSRKGDRHKYRLYKCDLCGLYHITTPTKTRPYKDIKRDKYPIIVGEKKKQAKPVNIPVIPVKKPNNWGGYATERMIDPQTARALKQLVENRKYLEPK